MYNVHYSSRILRKIMLGKKLDADPDPYFHKMLYPDPAENPTNPKHFTRTSEERLLK